MTRPQKTITVTAVIIAAIIFGVLFLRHSPGKPPNVILISIDTLRADHLGCYGYGRETSPVLDRLAEDGAIFELAFSSTSWTLPAHAAMFTGLPDRAHGACHDYRCLIGSRETLTEAFLDAGYHTAGFFSGPMLHNYFGFSQGFEKYEDCTSYAEYSLESIRSRRFNNAIFDMAPRDVTNPTILKSVLHWLDDRPPRPFFLFIHMWDVHGSYIPPEPYDTMFTENGQSGTDRMIALYDGEICWTDYTIGEILKELSRRGLKDSTVIAVTADHGEAFFEHGKHGHRKSVHDEEVHIPLLLRYPPAIPPNTRIPRLVGIIDVAPTLLELAGLPPLPAAMGRSMVPLLRDPESEDWKDEPVFSELQSPLGIKYSSLRGRDWRLVVNYADFTHEMFDLKRDPTARSPLEESEYPMPPVELDRLYRNYTKRIDAVSKKLEKAYDLDMMTMPQNTRKHLKSLGYLK